jgi:hypothetical protein
MHNGSVHSKRLLSAALIAHLALSFAHPLRAELGAMKNEDVIRLVKSGASRITIQTTICNAEPDFVLTNTDSLRGVGVSEWIINLMRFRQRGESCANAGWMHDTRAGIAAPFKPLATFSPLARSSSSVAPPPSQSEVQKPKTRKILMFGLIVGVAAGTAFLGRNLSSKGYGNCRYPDDLASDGSRCGGRAASVRPGGLP